jgi:hypothetical protein
VHSNRAKPAARANAACAIVMAADNEPEASKRRRYVLATSLVET